MEDVDSAGDPEYVGDGIFGVVEAESLAFLIHLRALKKNSICNR